MNAIKTMSARLLKKLAAKHTVLFLAPVLGMTALSAAPASAHSRFSLDLSFFFPITLAPAPCPPPAPAVYPAPCPPPAPQACPAPAPVWVDPVYQTVLQNVWVPPHTEYQTVERRYGYRRYFETVPVFIPGHYEQQTSTVLVTPGHWQ